MDINPLNKAPLQADSSDLLPTKNGDASGDMFLKLLVAQIENQDPTNPTDSAQFINQFSQLSQIESMNKMTREINKVGTLVDNIQLLTLSSLVGKQAYAEGSHITLQENSKANGRLHLAHAGANLTLHIKDATGQETVIPLGDQPAGDVNFTIDATKLGLRAGKYSLSAVADGGMQNIPMELSGIVNSIRVDPDSNLPVLTLSGVGDVPYTQLRQFGSRSTA
ncbi:flagellar basal-body rod modification protein FlgD [Izhakiella capsodis]|uniref:Basal-body rod modification protein FlgD n=1 Tax=Izhakiella capsodis TaxID=1367852 RepID=A0A1I4YCB2_9GAMM|nr:flagellar hook capping FlgD N-terminal domain-containing protein [Izhakiella capsodis]SFN35240.1 flagellar basal-body rod modification protein FlgD [Izhakiella capsodis]